jgi:plasmid replication initiation protein
LKQYQNIGRRRIGLEDIRKIFMLKESEYKSYKDFKKWVLVPSQQELEEKTDITFTWTEEKQWRNVVALEFLIQSKKKDLPPLISSQCQELPQSQEISETKAQKTTPPSLLAARLMENGIARKTAEELAQGYDEKHIRTMISYAESQHREGKIKNLAAFLVKAIKNEYRDTQAEEQDKKEKLKQEQASLEQQEQERQRKQKEQRKLAIDNFLSSLDKDGLFTLQAEFLEDGKDNGSMLASYRRNGMESPMVNGCFRDYIFRNRISKPPSA